MLAGLSAAALQYVYYAEMGGRTLSQACLWVGANTYLLGSSFWGSPPRCAICSPEKQNVGKYHTYSMFWPLLVENSDLAARLFETSTAFCSFSRLPRDESFRLS
jgi:hypothetical protein